MSASAVFILDMKGRSLISRDYRGDIPTSVATKFATRFFNKKKLSLVLLSMKKVFLILVLNMLIFYFLLLLIVM